MTDEQNKQIPKYEKEPEFTVFDVVSNRFKNEQISQDVSLDAPEDGLELLELASKDAGKVKVARHKRELLNGIAFIETQEPLSRQTDTSKRTYMAYPDGRVDEVMFSTGDNLRALSQEEKWDLAVLIWDANTVKP